MDRVAAVTLRRRPVG